MESVHGTDNQEEEWEEEEEEEEEKEKEEEAKKKKEKGKNNSKGDERLYVHACVTSKHDTKPACGHLSPKKKRWWGGGKMFAHRP